MVTTVVVLACVVVMVKSLADDSASRPASSAGMGGSGQAPAITLNMRTSIGSTFYQSIARNINARDAASLRIACDGAEARLAKSRDNDEIRDWLDLADSCNAGLAGDWTTARTELP